MLKRKDSKPQTLKSQMRLFILAIILIITIANLIIGISISYKGIIHMAERDLSSTGQAVSIALREHLTQMKLNIEASSRGESLHAVNPNTLNLYLENQCSLYGYKDLTLLNSTGQVISSTSPGTVTDYSDKYYVQRALNKETVVSTTEYDGDHRLIIRLTAPNGGYVLMATYDGSILSDLIKDIHMGKTGNVFLLDNTGTMIANVRSELVQNRQNFIDFAKTQNAYKSAAKVYSTMVTGASGLGRYEYGGVKRICYYGPVPGSDGWSFGAVAPINELTSAIRNVALFMVIAAALFILAGIIASIRFAGAIADPVRAITKRMGLLSKGDLSSGVPEISSKNEVGVLAEEIKNSITSLNLYVHEIGRVMKELSSGSLNSGFTVEFRGDFQEISRSVSQTMKMLSSTISSINDSAAHVASGSDQVAAGAQNLSQGATEQAATLEELSSSVSHISQQISSTSVEMETISQKAIDMGRSMELGNEQMNTMVLSMNNIREKSRQIEHINKVIEDIAFQTNILALNAAVEAARAGAAGKGFAVVADEVRNLAGKSSAAARDTTVLVNDAISCVEEGSATANEAGRSLSAMMSEAQDIIHSIHEASHTLKAQSASVTQVNTGIEQISSVVQNNSATAEESAATSSELSRQAEALKKLIHTFRLKS